MLQIMERNKRRVEKSTRKNKKGFRVLPYKLNFAGAQIQCLLGQKIRLFGNFRNKKRTRSGTINRFYFYFYYTKLYAINNFYIPN